MPEDGPLAPRTDQLAVPQKRRRVVIIPIVLFIIAAAAGPIIRWAGQHSSATLPYREALGILLDRSENPNRRSSAQGRVLTSLKRAIQVMQFLAAADDPRQKAAAEAALSTLANEIRATGERTPVPPQASWQFENTLSALAGPDRSGATEALAEITQAATTGIQALKQVMGEDPTLARNTRLAIRSLTELLRRENR